MSMSIWFIVLQTSRPLEKNWLADPKMREFAIKGTNPPVMFLAIIIALWNMPIKNFCRFLRLITRDLA